MKITLLQYTENAEDIIAQAAKLCYSQDTTEEIHAKGIEPEERKKLLRKVISSGHHSVLEHATFTFGIDGISRACSHQLVRHRLASFSQKSNRYVKEMQFEYIIPTTIQQATEWNNGEEMKFQSELFAERMELIQQWYNEAIKQGIPAEDARYYLPHACATNIVMTMNVRELIHFFSLRTCERAQWEIKEVAEQMLLLCKEVSETLFETAGAPCLRGECKEATPCKVAKLFEYERRN